MKETIYMKHSLKSVVDVTKVITIHYFEYNKDYQFRGESHDFWEFMYSDRGNVIVTCDEEDYILKQGHIIFLKPNHFHNVRADHNKPSNVFIMSFEAKSSMLDFLGNKLFKLSSEMKELIHSIIQEGDMAFELPMQNPRVRKLVERKDAVLGSQQILKMRLEELIILILRNQNQENNLTVFTSKTRFDDYIAEQIADILKKNVYGCLDLSRITNELGYGKTYLSGIFKRVYNVSIMNYYTNLKIEEAKYLIRENKMTIAEISDLLGFSSPQYFSKRFSQVVQMSPQQYSVSIKEKWKTEVKN